MLFWAWVVAVVGSVGAWAVDRRRRLYADLPTTPAAAVFAGRNEVVGAAWTAHPTLSHRTSTPSVAWSWLLEEERRHTRTVTSTDSKGNTTSRTETYEQWHKIDSREHQLAELEVVDATGSALVRMTGAKVVVRTFETDVYRRDAEGGFLSRMVDNRTGRYRETEKGIAVGDRLFVVGEAVLDPHRLVPVLHDDVLVSTRTEESHRGWLGAGALALLLVGAVATVVATSLTIDPDGPTRPTTILPGVAVVATGLLLSWAATSYNRLRLVAQGVDRAWSLIDVQLRRRHDLIPALAQVVRGHAEHESELLVAVAVAVAVRRTVAVGAARRAADLEAAADEQTADLRQVIALAEAHPELTADESFRSLAAQLADTEDRIAGSRTFYNDSLTLLEDRRQRFPDSLIARRVPLAHRELLGAEHFERTVPPVRREVG